MLKKVLISGLVAIALGVGAFAMSDSDTASADTGSDSGWSGGMWDYGNSWHYTPDNGLWFGWYY